MTPSLGIEQQILFEALSATIVFNVFFKHADDRYSSMLSKYNYKSLLFA